MNPEPLVSVIVPNYNHARYLRQRLDSIFHQTYKNIEVIILDDCSTDNSLDVIEEYRANPKVSHILINDTNTGNPFKQWDKGLSFVKGDLIWIAESDDYAELDFLETLVKSYLRVDGAVLVFSQYVLFNNDHQVSYKEHKTRVYRGASFVKFRQSRINRIVNASGAVFSRGAYSQISREYTSYRSAGDCRFWAELFNYGKVVCVGKNLCHFRQSSSSVTGTNVGRGITFKEEKRVHDYIIDNYHLNRWQLFMSRKARARRYQQFQFDSDTIRQEVLTLWNITSGDGMSSFYSVLFWLSDAAERHFGILI